MAVTCSTHGSNADKILVKKSEGKRPLGKPRRRWEDIIRKYLREIGWKVMDWIHPAQRRTSD
jgi:hypothetical protein